MIVLSEEIGDEGLELDWELSVSYLSEVLDGSGSSVGFKPAVPSMLHAAFRKISGKLLLNGEASVRLVGTCKRCLTAVEVDVPVQFELSLVSRPSQPTRAADGEAVDSKFGNAKLRDEEGHATSFGMESVDEELYDGKKIDLGEIVREQLLLALPMDVLCKESCKGLCALCGKDLNLAECGCERKVSDPRWTALKDIKLN